MKTTATRKRTVTTPSQMPFPVPEPVDRALKSAAQKVEAVKTEGREVVAKVEETVREAAEKVKVTGRKLAADPKAFVDDVVRDGKDIPGQLRKKAKEVGTGVSKEATRLADDVSKRVTGAVERVVEKTLHRFNVPTRQELRTLTSKVDALGKKIDALNTARPRPRTRRTPR